MSKTFDKSYCHTSTIIVAHERKESVRFLEGYSRLSKYKDSGCASEHIQSIFNCKYGHKGNPLSKCANKKKSIFIFQCEKYRKENTPN